MVRGRRGQGKSELGATGGRAPDRDPPAVRLDQAAHEVQPEPGAAASPSVPEAGEDPLQVGLVDALALVAHADHHDGLGRRAGGEHLRAGHDVQGDGAVAVAHGVFQQVREHLVEPVGVGPHLGQLAVGVDDEPPVVGAAGHHAVDVAAGGRLDVDRLAAHLQAPGVDARDVEQLGDQPGDAVGVVLDGLEHEALLVVGEPLPPAQQRRGEALDRRQRRAQLVGHRRDEGAVLLVGAAPADGVAHREHDAVDRCQVGGPVVGGGDEQLDRLLLAGEQQQPLTVAGAGGQPAPRVGARPPAPTLGVLQRQGLADVAAEQVVTLALQDARQRRR